MMSAHSSIREQEYFAPLLFPLYSTEGAQAAGTPRAATPHRREDSSMSTQRRSITTPGSVHTETTPPTPPPPVMRLTDDVVMDEPSASKAARMAVAPPPMQSLTPIASTAGRMADSIIPYEPAPQYQDVWVTIFGFAQQDVPLILREFSKCGDILQWGSFGQPSANFLHVQFQNKYAAQRALLRNGEQLSPALIVGVKPLDMRHRSMIEQYHAGGPQVAASASGVDGHMSVARPSALPDRPYLIEAPKQTPMPQPRSMASKVVEFVFGF